MRFPFNKKKTIITVVCAFLFIVFFYAGYRIGFSYSLKTFPEPQEKWTKEDKIRIDPGISPDVIRLADGTWKMYYTVNEGIVSAFSQNGLEWNKDEGVRVQPEYHSKEQGKIGSPSVIKLAKGGFRMLYEGSDTKQTAFAIFSAVSTDGIEWKKEKGKRLTATNRFDQSIAASPDVVTTPDGRLFMYFSDGDTIKLAVSSDEGKTWRERGISGLPEACLDPTVKVMSDGMYRMYFAKSASSDRLLKAKILSARSSDGIDWTVESGVRIEADKGATMVLDPDVVMVSLGKMRIYYSQVDKGIVNGTGASSPVVTIRSAALELR